MHPHAESSGLLPDGGMPECFLAASVLDHLGDEVTMTIENEFQKSDRLEGRQRRSTDCYPPDRPR